MRNLIDLLVASGMESLNRDIPSPRPFPHESPAQAIPELAATVLSLTQEDLLKGAQLSSMEFGHWDVAIMPALQGK